MEFNSGFKGLNIKIFFCALFFILPDYHNGFCSATSVCQMLFCWLHNNKILKNKNWKPVYVFRFYPPKQEFNLTLLAYSMEHSPSWEANRFSASQEISRILWNMKVYYRLHTCQSPVLILSELDPVHVISNTNTVNLIFMDPCIVVWISRNNQQDATLYHNLLFHLSLKVQHVSSGTPLIIRSSNCICSLWFTHACDDRP